MNSPCVPMLVRMWWGAISASVLKATERPSPRKSPRTRVKTSTSVLNSRTAARPACASTLREVTPVIVTPAGSPVRTGRAV
ncbi:hypothetical protein JYU34_016172 [Plutella xylostella]|uniref:Secreted protein n=1 Tax=Plutella xylostella TaxID=51655 RepID=A0ABQ7Q9B2_PLUXY|nr:hypothetical protein JYU34_016172 [Plutella xylostella]